MLQKQDTNDRYYDVSSYAYKDDDRTWYHAVDNSRRSYPPPPRGSKWYYAELALKEENETLPTEEEIRTARVFDFWEKALAKFPIHNALSEWFYDTYKRHVKST